ncbi:MAG TPA: hypothetical protein VFE61_19170 [Candidatus Sulfotelmatobacter sp.]|jgi:hypothetical protein|nr:hypothetical protein [Candidatus Sulfotelmatobacter sp.]
MIKQFAKTMLILVGVAGAAAMPPSIYAQAAGSNVVNHGYNTNMGIFDFNVGELTFINVNRVGQSYVFAYQMFGPFSGAGSGPIPASSVHVSGSSVSAGNVTFTLNVNTCNLDPSSYTTSQGTCGIFDISWIQMPASVGGSTTTSGTIHETAPGGGTTTINGHTETFTAQLSGTAIGYALPSCCGALEELTNSTVTHTK